MKLYSVIFFILVVNANAISGPKAGELCGGWFVAGRSELDDEVFYECVAAKKENKNFVEAKSRNKNARKLCKKEGLKNINNCVRKMLSIPSRLAIQENKKRNQRGIASEK